MKLYEFIIKIARELPGVSLDDFLAVTNRKVRDLHGERRWRAYEAQHQFELEEPYSTGTVSIDVDTKTVTGVGTVWIAAHVGWKIKFNGSSHYYLVDSVAGNLSLDLVDDFFEDSVAGVKYELYQDAYAIPADFAELRSLQNLQSEREYDADDFWVYQGAYIVFYATPFTTAPILMSYWRKSTDVDSPADDIDVPDILEDVLHYSVVGAYLNRQAPPDEEAQARLMVRIRQNRDDYVRALRRAKARDTGLSGGRRRLKRVLV